MPANRPVGELESDGQRNAGTTVLAAAPLPLTVGSPTTEAIVALLFCHGEPALVPVRALASFMLNRRNRLSCSRYGSRSASPFELKMRLSPGPPDAEAHQEYPVPAGGSLLLAFS